MERIDDFSDDRNKAWCIHCHGTLAELETSEDHVPTKGLLTKPRPHNLPIVSICARCNNGFSFDEEYLVTLLSCVLAGSTDPEMQANESAKRSLVRSPALRAQIDKLRRETRTPTGDVRTTWEADIARISRVVLKNARGHAYFEFGEPMLNEPVSIFVRPMVMLTAQERHSFEHGDDEFGLSAWPEVGSRMMTRVLSGQDMHGSWVVVQEGNYRYSVKQADGGLRVRSVIWEYLATEVQWED